jgi:hypothetical protein
VLLETALGGPLQGNAQVAGSSDALDVALTACPSPEAQVSCLLELAGDPNMLCRQWQGIAPWV